MSRSPPPHEPTSAPHSSPNWDAFTKVAESKLKLHLVRGLEPRIQYIKELNESVAKAQSRLDEVRERLLRFEPRSDADRDLIEREWEEVDSIEAAVDEMKAEAESSSHRVLDELQRISDRSHLTQIGWSKDGEESPFARPASSSTSQPSSSVTAQRVKSPLEETISEVVADLRSEDTPGQWMSRYFPLTRSV